MCDLCKLVDFALHGGDYPGYEKENVRYVDGLCIIVDSLGDKPGKDGFIPKVCIYRQHLIDPLPPLKKAILDIVKRKFRKRNLFFPQTTDNKDYDLKSENRLALREWPAHWWIIIE